MASSRLRAWRCQSSVETSAGQDSDAQLDLNALAEQPVARPPKEEPKRIPPGETKEPVVDKPAIQYVVEEAVRAGLEDLGHLT